MLNTVAHGLLNLSQNLQFRQLVASEAGQQFDGENNVLMKTLTEKAQIDLSINMESEFQLSVNQHKGNLIETPNSLLSTYKSFSALSDAVSIGKSVDNFSAFGHNLYPQIYIPFENDVDLNEQPIIVVGFDDVDEVIGYRKLSDGNFEVIKVDENMAQNNLVWVVSINERVGDNGMVNDAFLAPSGPTGEPTGGGGGDPTGGGPTGPNDLMVYISDINIFVDKESWSWGDAEVMWVGRQQNYCEDLSPVHRNPFLWTDNNEFHEYMLYNWVGLQSGLPSVTGGSAFNYIIAWNNAETASSASNTGLVTELKVTPTVGEAFRLVMYESDQGTTEWSVTYPSFWTACNTCSAADSYHSKQTPYGVLDVNAILLSQTSEWIKTYFPLAGYSGGTSGANVKLRSKTNF